ncbi:MAG TPA: hypothetical protein VMI31_02240 [Fimbriimonadaceae bacterium]|nr:hypothetical protein [Fimbriimonadaceae bacterium]
MIEERALEALAAAEGLEATPGNLTRVADATSESAARWAFGQWALRKRARAKFALADRMLFDSDGFEMASHEAVAGYHASCFSDGAEAADLSCGIGSDLIALARRGSALGFEFDPFRAACARHNLAVHELDAEVRVGDCLTAIWPSGFAFCDPSRRSQDLRRRSIADWTPDPFAVAERFRSLRLGGLKLSPMTDDRDLDRLGGSVEFVSFGGECREALVWLGSLSRPGRRAVHIETGTFLESSESVPAVSTPKGRLFDADPAAIRAHCLGELGRRYGLSALGDSNGYLSGDADADTPWLRAYEVLAFHSADVKRTRTDLRRLGAGTPIVKCRGAKIDVDALRKELRGEGEELVVVVYPDGRSLKHVICRAAKPSF